jgi:hypothetical protein
MGQRDGRCIFGKGGAPCAGGGHFVAGIGLRLALPTVAREIGGIPTLWPRVAIRDGSRAKANDGDSELRSE